MTKDRGSNSRLLFLALAFLLIATIAGAVVFSKVQQSKSRVNTMPRVLSKIKNLQVISATVINPDTPAAGVAIEIRNNSELAVMAVDLVSGEGAITKNGLSDEDHPIVVIPPHGTTIVEMTFGEMTPGAPLVVSAVTYADGTEEGEEEPLRIMHKIREHDKAKMKTEREEKKEGQ